MKWFLLIPFILCVICVIFLCFSILNDMNKKYVIKKSYNLISVPYLSILKLLIYSFIPVLNLCLIFLILFTDFETRVQKEVVKNLKADGLIEEKIDKNEYV